MRAPKKAVKPKWHPVIYGAILVVALGLGLLATFVAGWHAGRDDTRFAALASQNQIAQAKRDITTAYLAASTKDCTDPATHAPYDGAAYFAQYLQVNAYANRATIRPCNTGGELLAKLNGKWVETQVNLNLSARANPQWARACWAIDILAPDTVARPENRTIDADNLKLCQALQQGKNLTISEL